MAGVNAFSAHVKIMSLNVRGLRSKTLYVKHLLLRHNPDVLCLQETNIYDDYSKNKAIYDLGLDESNSFFNYPNSKANGTAIIVLTSNLKCENAFFFDDGRTIFIDLLQGNYKFTLLNIYVPTNATQRVIFLDSLFLKIQNHTNRNHLIMAGDFNIILQDIDITGIKGHLRIGRPELQNIVSSFRLNDAFRTLFPNKIETTFENKNIKRAARLDRIYASEHIPIASSVHISSSLDFADHKATLSTFSSSTKFYRENPKSAHWKFNDTLLDDADFVTAIKETIEANCFNCNEYNIIEKFDILDTTFKKIAIFFSGKIEKKRNEKLNLLNMIIRATESKPHMNNSEQLLFLKQERDDILNHKY